MNQTRSEAVIGTVATAEGVDPSQLLTPLYTFVDPDALDSLFRTGGGSVQFSYCGYWITVDASGTVGYEPVE
ncbi:HalOD1 output domain-containing protein [Halobacteriaceae archaeon SHR40]|uniref:HalOD1 output domain-containing protein n=1 Tax=Halovenus amylolytica TaxID=2500550 RepID=UPI000FE4360B